MRMFQKDTLFQNTVHSRYTTATLFEKLDFTVQAAHTDNISGATLNDIDEDIGEYIMDSL